MTDVVLPLTGSSLTCSDGDLRVPIPIFATGGGGGYDNFGTDMRAGLKAQYEQVHKKELLEQAKQEDLILLATVKSTLSNPKYGF